MRKILSVLLIKILITLLLSINMNVAFAGHVNADGNWSEDEGDWEKNWISDGEEPQPKTCPTRVQLDAELKTQSHIKPHENKRNIVDPTDRILEAIQTGIREGQLLNLTSFYDQQQSLTPAANKKVAALDLLTSAFPALETFNQHKPHTVNLFKRYINKNLTQAFKEVNYTLRATPEQTQTMVRTLITLGQQEAVLNPFASKTATDWKAQFTSAKCTNNATCQQDLLLKTLIVYHAQEIKRDVENQPNEIKKRTIQEIKALFPQLTDQYASSILERYDFVGKEEGRERKKPQSFQFAADIGINTAAITNAKAENKHYRETIEKLPNDLEQLMKSINGIEAAIPQNMKDEAQGGAKAINAHQEGDWKHQVNQLGKWVKGCLESKEAKGEEKLRLAKDLTYIFTVLEDELKQTDKTFAQLLLEEMFIATAGCPDQNLASLEKIKQIIFIHKVPDPVQFATLALVSAKREWVRAVVLNAFATHINKMGHGFAKFFLQENVKDESVTTTRYYQLRLNTLLNLDLPQKGCMENEGTYLAKLEQCIPNKSEEGINQYVRDLVLQAINYEGLIDMFSDAGQGSLGIGKAWRLFLDKQNHQAFADAAEDAEKYARWEKGYLARKAIEALKAGGFITPVA